MNHDQATGGGTLLLYTGDSASDRLTVEHLWERIAGAPPRCVQDGVGLIEYLDACAEGREPWPRLILLDLNMPRMNGYEMLERIKSSQGYARLPVVVLSTSARDEDVNECYALGANGYLVKASDPSDLEETLQGTHDFWFRWCATPDQAQ